MDYIDKYSISVCTKKQITAQEVYDMELHQSHTN